MSNERKNIAIVIDSLGGGGAERVMLNLAKAIANLGHYAHIISLEARRDHEVDAGIPLSVLYSDRSLKKITRGKNIPRSSKDLKSLISGIEGERGRFSLYLSNLDPTNAVMAYCDFPNTYYVLHSAMKHEIERERRLGPFKWYRKVRAKKVMDGKDLIAVSKGVEEEALKLGVVTPNTVKTIYNPVDIESILELAKVEIDTLPDEPYLLHVGRVVKAKRHDVLFDALRLVPDIKLVLLCKDVDKVRKLARKYGVEERIITPGFTSNPYVWMKHAELCVLSSEYEGLSMVLIESLVCGTPVVSTNCNYGPSEILLGELSEYLSPVNDSLMLAENINKALSKESINLKVPILDDVRMEVVAQKYVDLCD